MRPSFVSRRWWLMWWLRLRRGQWACSGRGWSCGGGARGSSSLSASAPCSPCPFAASRTRFLRASCWTPNPGAARAAPRRILYHPRTRPHVAILRYNTSIKATSIRCPKTGTGKSTLELPGRTKETLVYFVHHSRNHECENQPPFAESQLPPVFFRLVYSRYNRTSRRLSVVFAGISRMLILNTGTVP